MKKFLLIASIAITATASAKDFSVKKFLKKQKKK